MFVARFFGYPGGDPFFVSADFGTAFLVSAGMLNVLTILDAYDIAARQKTLGNPAIQSRFVIECIAETQHDPKAPPHSSDLTAHHAGLLVKAGWTAMPLSGCKSGSL